MRSTQTILLCLMHIFHTIRIQMFSEHTGLNITMHGVWIIFQVTVTPITLIGALQIWLITLIAWDLFFCLLTYFINISVASYFIPYVSILDFLVFVNYVTSENNNMHRLQWIHNFFTKVMGDLGRCSSDDMDYIYENDAPEFLILTMGYKISPLLTTTPIDTHN